MCISLTLCWSFYNDTTQCSVQPPRSRQHREIPRNVTTGIHFHVSYISTFHTFPRFIHFHVSCISTFHAFPRFIHFHVSYVYTFHTFPRFIHLHVSYISTFHTFPRFMQFHVSYIYTFHTFPRFIHFHVSCISTFHAFPRFIHFHVSYIQFNIVSSEYTPKLSTSYIPVLTYFLIKMWMEKCKIQSISLLIYSQHNITSFK
jgi:hypothetical protein